MEASEPNLALTRTVQTQKMIHLALLGGATIIGILLTVVHFIVLEGKPVAPNLPKVGGISVLVLVAGVVAVAAIGATFIAPTMLRKQAVAQLAAVPPETASGRILMAWQSASLVQAGLLEGTTVLSLVLFLTCGEVVLLAIAAVMLVLLAMHIPSEQAARRWIDRATEEWEQKRAGG